MQDALIALVIPQAARINRRSVAYGRKIKEVGCFVHPAEPLVLKIVGGGWFLLPHRQLGFQSGVNTLGFLDLLPKGSIAALGEAIMHVDKVENLIIPIRH